jgi:predicted  nucleic acid-binding Zn-ribbon protein
MLSGLAKRRRMSKIVFFDVSRFNPLTVEFSARSYEELNQMMQRKRELLDELRKLKDKRAVSSSEVEICRRELEHLYPIVLGKVLEKLSKKIEQRARELDEEGSSIVSQTNESIFLMTR